MTDLVADVTPEALAKIPAVHRHTIALWMAQRAAAFRSSNINPLIPAGEYRAAADALWGAGVDLIDPLAEDTTLEHAHEVLSRLTRYDGSDAETTEVPR